MRARLALAAVTAVLSTAPPATAAPPNDATYRGGCVLVAVNETTQVVNPADHWSGVVGAAVVTYAPTLGHNPVAASVSCEVYVNGAPAGSGSFTGTTVTGGAQGVTFTATIPPDSVTLCTTVKTTDAHAQLTTQGHCAPGVVVVEAAPQPVLDAANALCAALSDYTLCALLKANRGRVLVAV